MDFKFKFITMFNEHCSYKYTEQLINLVPLHSLLWSRMLSNRICLFAKQCTKPIYRFNVYLKLKISKINYI